MTATSATTRSRLIDSAVARFARIRQYGWSSESTAILVIVVALTTIGLVMSFSASFVDAAREGDAFGVARRQLFWAGIGLPGYLLAANITPATWRKVSWWLMGGVLIGLILVLIPSVGIERSGSSRWLGIGPMVVQPSEIAKIATLLWLADVMVRKRPKDGSPHQIKHLLVPALPLLGVQAILLLLEPDLGTTMLIGLIVLLVLFVEGLPWRHLAAFAGVAAVLAGAAAVAAPYRFARITGWLDPEADPLNTGFQLLQSRFSMASGGWLGLGLGSSRGKWNFIPNPETDFIYAIIGEELGLVGAVGVLSLFMALLVVGLRVARRTQDPYGQVVAFVITAWIVGQALLNVSTVMGLLPITGVTLPLVSVGGSSLVSMLFALGILTAIGRTVPEEGLTIDLRDHVAEKVNA